MSILVIDVGTSSVRATVVEPDGSVALERVQPLLPATPFPGLVEIDGRELAAAVLGLATSAIEDHGPVEAVGVANQRCSTLLWDRTTGELVGPGLGWQDLRTVVECLTLNGEGLRVAPNQSATKLAWLLDQHDPQRSRSLCFGTVDTWVVWALTGGRVHVTDAGNAGVTGLVTADGSRWHDGMLARLRIDPDSMPTIVDSTGVIAEASALPGSPPIAGIAGDQQAALMGQSCVRGGDAKITFGTGGFLDLCAGDRPLALGSSPDPTAHGGGRGPNGCFTIVAWRAGGAVTWAAEAIMLSAGTNVEWLRDDLGVIADAAASDAVAAQCTSTGGVVYVPALLGLGTPAWDYGARGTLLGITRGTGRPELVRAVLEGVAHRGTDLVEAAEADTAMAIGSLRVDGGMSANSTFVQALADASQRPVEVSRHREATTIGAAYLAGLAVGTWGGLDDVASAWAPSRIVEPAAPLDRDGWRAAVERAKRWIPDLSVLDF